MNPWRYASIRPHVFIVLYLKLDALLTCTTLSKWTRKVLMFRCSTLLVTFDTQTTHTHTKQCNVKGRVCKASIMQCHHLSCYIYFPSDPSFPLVFQAKKQTDTSLWEVVFKYQQVQVTNAVCWQIWSQHLWSACKWKSNNLVTSRETNWRTLILYQKSPWYYGSRAKYHRNVFFLSLHRAFWYM